MKKNIVLSISLIILVTSCFSLFETTSSSATEKNITKIDRNSTPHIAVILPNKNNPDSPEAKDVMIGINRLAREFNGVIHGIQETVEFGRDVEFRIFRTDGDFDYAASEKITAALQTFNLQSFDLVIGTGSQYGLPFYNINQQYGLKQFVVLDAVSFFGISNIHEVEIEIKDSAFIAGAVAAERFTGEKLGVIGDFDCEFINENFIDPFIEGVEYMDLLLGRYTDVIVEYPDDLHDNRELYHRAGRFYKNGVQCIYQAASLAGNGIIDAARDNGKWVIGCNLDQGLEAALNGQQHEHILTSTQKKLGNAAYLVGKEYLKTGSLPKIKQTVGLAEDCVDISINPHNTPILGEQIETIRELKKALVNGNLDEASEKILSADRADTWKSRPAGPPQDAATLTVSEPVLSPGLPAHYSQILQEAISTELLNSGTYKVIDREQVKNLLSEISFSLEGVSDDTRQLEIGRLAAAETMVFVNLGQVKEGLYIDCKLVDVETGLALTAVRETYPDFESSLEGLSSLINGLK